MKAKIKSQFASGEYYPVLEDSKGKMVAGPFTTFDSEEARRYAEFAAERNPHDDIDKSNGLAE